MKACTQLMASVCFAAVITAGLTSVCAEKLFYGKGAELFKAKPEALKKVPSEDEAKGGGAQPSGPPDKTVALTLCSMPEKAVETGKTVTISLPAGELGQLQAKSVSSGIPLRFQWRKDGVDISGETNANLILSNITLDAAASYTLQLTGSDEDETAPLHLSVYYQYVTNSTAGFMRTPIGAYDTHSSFNNICGFTGWTKYEAFYPFDGPFKMAPVSTIFPNPDNKSKLDIDTCISTNGSSLDTAVRVRLNEEPMTELCCNNLDNCSGAGNAKLDKCMNVLLQSNKTYRVSIYLKNVGTQPHVTFHWHYHD